MMKREFSLFRLFGIQISVMPSAVIGSVIVWIVATLLMNIIMQIEMAQSAVGGFIAMLLHWFSELVHQLGHAWVARGVGHPMKGIRFWGVLGTSLYPKDEPTLPNHIHILRALGGPFVSAAMMTIGAVLIMRLEEIGGVQVFLAVWFALENLLIFTMGAAIPLPKFLGIENDGITIMRYWGKKS